MTRDITGHGLNEGFFPFISAFLVASISPFTPASANDALLSEEAFLDELPIVLSASRLPQSPANTPIATTVIDREMIVASGFTEIPDLLRLAPGFIVNYENGYNQAVGYHVLSDQYSRQMQVLVDGRSVYEPSLGGVSWTDLPLAIDDIERIEVMRGPNASSYGANAFTAIINIITRQAVLDRGLMLKSNIGSDGLTEGYMRYGGAHKNMDYRVTAAYRENNGFDDRYDDMQVRLITVRGDFQLDLDNTLMVQLGHNSGSKEDDDVFDELVPDHKKQTYSQFQQIRLTHTLTADQDVSVQFYHNQNKNINDFNSTPVAALGGTRLYFDERVTADRWDIEFQNILKPAKPLRLVWGAGARKDEVVGPTFFNTNRHVVNDSWRIFTNSEYYLTDKTLLNAGVVYEDSDTGGRNISPRASVNHHFHKNHTLRLSASRAYRDPFVFEESPDYRFPLPAPNNVLLFDAGNIDSERITAREIGYIGNFPRVHTSLDVRYFHEKLEKLISFDKATFSEGVDGTALFFNNLNSAQIKGVEVSASYRPGNGNRINISYTHQDIDSHDMGGNGNYADAGPENMLNALVIHDFKNGYSASAGFYYLSSMKELSTNDVRRAQYRTDIRLARTLSTARQNITLALVVQNLFDNDEETRLRNNIDRRAYGSISLSFK
ncbi:TonB-dependent receptor plug domain-containing protein [Thiogranum longum]|uniref:TonB-dependent receptor plug domain-containing protein n=1 Tax=Thiogranum longum TaxID=1537524 RepID=UPI0014024FE2|nr:TonB-dependent receptor [Thiogranum longum]